jgi:hypothetical protein
MHEMKTQDYYFKLFFMLAVTSILSLQVYAQDRSDAQRSSEKAAKRKARQQKIENYIRQQEEGALVFNSQMVYGLRLNTDGWNFLIERGKMRSVKVANIYYLEIGEKKNPKEKKVTNTFQSGNFIQSGNPYIYGKQNIFYQVKPGFGQQRMIGAKTNKNGIALHWMYSGGASFGLLRPYYVTIIEEPSLNVFVERDIKYNPKNPAEFLTPGNILQGTGLRHGWNEMKIVPGLHAKSALRFDYGRFNELVSAIEVGLNVEYYFNDIDILVNNSPQKFFLNAFVAILIGKRK